MASIVAQLGISESAPVQMIRGLRRIAQDLTVDFGMALAYAAEARTARRQSADMWAAYEAHEGNGHLWPHELAYADGLNEYEEGMDNE